MSNTQNTNYFNQLLTSANTSNDPELTQLIMDMNLYSELLESAIKGEVETFDFQHTNVTEFKNRIDQLDSSILEELGGLLQDFLVYIITYEKLLFYMVESFQRSGSLQCTPLDDVVENMRKKGKSKIPPAKSLPSRPRPDELDLAQIITSLNQLFNVLDMGLFIFLSSFAELLEVLEQLTPFINENKDAITFENNPSLEQLTNDMSVYTLSLIPQVLGLQAPQIFGDLKSVLFNSALTDMQSDIDSVLYTKFQSFLNYIETLENASI